MKFCMYLCDLLIEFNELLLISILMDFQFLSFVMKIFEFWVCDYIILLGDSIVDYVFGVVQNGVKFFFSILEFFVIY